MYWWRTRSISFPSKLQKLNCKFPDPTNDENKIAVPGETSFISYKTSLYDYCQHCGWHPPVYITRQNGCAWTSKASFGGHVYFSKESKKLHRFKSHKQAIEQKAAYTALVGIGILNSKTKFNIDACMSVPCPGDRSFVSYKCSLHDFCQQYNILSPRYTTWKNHTGYSSMVQVGHMVSHTFNMPGHVENSQEVEQKAAFVALQELCLINSQASYRPELCFLIPTPNEKKFVSFKSCLHDFCHLFNVPSPQYITSRSSHGYTTKLKFGGMVFHTSDYVESKRILAEQHAAYEALQGLGLLESTAFFMESDFNRTKSATPPFLFKRSESSTTASTYSM